MYLKTILLRYLFLSRPFCCIDSQQLMLQFFDTSVHSCSLLFALFQFLLLLSRHCFHSCLWFCFLYFFCHCRLEFRVRASYSLCRCSHPCVALARASVPCMNGAVGFNAHLNRRVIARATWPDMPPVHELMNSKAPRDKLQAWQLYQLVGTHDARARFATWRYKSHAALHAQT